MDCDITKPLPFSDDLADMCLAVHVVEHVSCRDAVLFLSEIYRILKPGGFVRLCCPVVGPWLELHHAKDLCIGNGHVMILNEYSMRDLLWCAGFDPQKIIRSDWIEEDGHHKIIGRAKDGIETCRLVATK